MQEINPEKEKKEAVSETEEKEKIIEEMAETEEEKPEEEREALAERERIVRGKLEKEIAEAELTPELETEAKKKAEEIESLDEKGKLQRLLELAKEKGVAFAIGVAKDMKDPYTLDTFHDALIKDGLYKNFEK